MNNRYVYLIRDDAIPALGPVRISQLPEGSVNCGHNVFRMPLPKWEPKRFPPQPPRGGSGRIKASPRPGLIRRWGEGVWLDPWQPVSKARWRNAAKAKRHVARVSRRKIRVVLATSDPEGEANFRAQWGITLWDIY